MRANERDDQNLDPPRHPAVARMRARVELQFDSFA